MMAPLMRILIAQGGWGQRKIASSDFEFSNYSGGKNDDPIQPLFFKFHLILKRCQWSPGIFLHVEKKPISAAETCSWRILM
jgi:hypothetical protein